MPKLSSIIYTTKIPFTNHILPLQETAIASLPLPPLHPLMAHTISSALSTLVLPPSYYTILTLKITARSAELEAHKVEAEA